MLPIFLWATLGSLAPAQERRVGVVPEGVEAGEIFFARDGAFAAYVIREGESFRLVVGDWRSKPSLFPILPTLPKTGTDVFYAINVDRNLRVFQRDRALFDLQMDADMAIWGPGSLSGNGKVLAATTRNTRTGFSTVLLTGKPQKAYKGEISPPALNDDGSVVAFALENDDGFRVVVNDVLGPRYDMVTDPVVSADGKTIAYAAELNDKAFLIQGARKVPIPRPALGVFMTADGLSLGYWRSVKRPDGRKCMQVVVGDQAGPELADLKAAVFSPDGKHWTYRGETLEKVRCVVIDDRLLEVPALQGWPSFTEEGRKVGYGIRRGRELLWTSLELK